MSKLDELLQGVDVEWKALGQVCVFRNGFAFKSKLFKDSGLPIVRITNINEDRVDLTNVKFFDINDYKNTNLSNYIVESSDILIAMSGATTGKIGIYESQTISYLNQRVGKFKPNENVLLKKYLYYNLLFKSNFIYELAGGGAQPNLSSNLLMDKFLIPIPCPDHPEKSLEIQQEIVRVLDELTSLTNQLKTELETERQNRKKQFEFFREQLLSFEKGNVEWKELKDIFYLKNGYTPSKSKEEYWTDGTIPWFRMEDIRKNGRVLNKAIQNVNISAIKGGKLFPANSLIVATSATIGEHALVTVPYLSNQRFTNLSLKEDYTLKYNVEFLNYYCFILDEWCKNNTTIGNFAGVDMTKFRKFLFPIPPLEEQERIVKLLDQFDATHTAIEEEITKEIKLRTQQYEYYREKLLSFPSLRTT